MWIQPARPRRDKSLLRTRNKPFLYHTYRSSIVEGFFCLFGLCAVFQYSYSYRIAEQRDLPDYCYGSTISNDKLSLPSPPTASPRLKSKHNFHSSAHHVPIAACCAVFEKPPPLRRRLILYQVYSSTTCVRVMIRGTSGEPPASELQQHHRDLQENMKR